MRTPAGAVFVAVAVLFAAPAEAGLDLGMGKVAAKKGATVFDKAAAVEAKPAAPVSLQLSNVVIDGLDTYYQVPPSARGVIYFFHGTGGSAVNMSSNTEMRILAASALAQSHALVFLESTDRTAKQWTPTANPATNPDILHITAVRDYLRTSAGVSAQWPEYGVGMSNGGGYVPYAGYHFSYDAVAIYCAAGYDQVLQLADYAVPTFFMQAQNDTIVNNADIQTNYNLLVGKGVTTVLYTNNEEALTQERFTRIPGITTAESQGLFNSLIATGFIDADGAFLQSPRAVALGDVGVQYAAEFSDIKDQLYAVYAEHTFTSEFASQNLSFFSAQ
ncbi:MAG: hypothetical protein HY403_11125 [Elusimicrobia bacterium]|nr:hypothetical protein [Elusimicrobiota bacterium]